MNDDERVLQDWQDYVDAYDTGSDDARQHVNSVLNDPNASAADKEAARHDMIVQDLFGQWLRTTNDSIQESGVIPDSLHFDGGDIYGGLWSDGTNIKTGFMYTYSGNVVSGSKTYKLPVCCLDGEVLSIEAESTTTNLRFQRYRWNVQTTSGNVTFVIGNINDSGNIHWKFGGVDVTYAGSAYNGWCCYYHWGGGTPPIHTDFNNLARVSANTSQNWNAEQIIGNVSLISQTGFDVDPNAPWDAYNDNILPNIAPENAAFPDGYQPGTPRPDPELPELPGEEEHGGDNIEPNDTTGIGGGFGFMTQYALRAADIQELGKKLWAGFDPDDPNVDNYLRNFIYKISTTTGSVNFADIMDFFVSLRFYPCPLGNISAITAAGNDLYVGAGTEPITITNIIHTMDSYEGVLNAGTLTLPFWYGDFRDYQTQITLYLPYCGTAELNPVDVMGGTLECFYEIDFCTGGCTGYVWVTTWEGARYCVASLPGQLGADVPMSATNAGRVASRIMGDRITFTENLVSILRHGAGFAGAAASGNIGSAIDRAFSAFITPTISEEKRLNDELGKGAISAPVLGSGGGFATYKNPSTAYIQVRSAFYPDVTNYPDAVGNPASETVVIGDCEGFCRFVNVDITSVTADAREQTAIRQALENGVIL